jgi:hypothetical protein
MTWTTENTEGFTQPELDIINDVTEALMADIDDVEPYSIDDAINNAWFGGISRDALYAAARKSLTS